MYRFLQSLNNPCKYLQYNNFICFKYLHVLAHNQLIGIGKYILFYTDTFFFNLCLHIYKKKVIFSCREITVLPNSIILTCSIIYYK